MRKAVCIAVALFVCLLASGQRNWFHEDFVKSGALSTFKSGAKWLPYPDYSDREAWDALVSPAEKEGLIKNAEKNLDDKRIADDWGPHIYRITLRSTDKAPLKGKYVFSITNNR